MEEKKKCCSCDECTCECHVHELKVDKPEFKFGEDDTIISKKDGYELEVDAIVYNLTYEIWQYLLYNPDTDGISTYDCDEIDEAFDKAVLQ